MIQYHQPHYWGKVFEQMLSFVSNARPKTEHGPEKYMYTPEREYSSVLFQQNSVYTPAELLRKAITSATTNVSAGTCKFWVELASNCDTD